MKKNKTKKHSSEKAASEEAVKILELRKRHHCNEHSQACLVNENNHLRLTAAHLQIWAYDWVKI
jgi:hypothetical protein